MSQQRVSFHDFYNAITCNRCGQCCEAFTVPPIEKLTPYLPWSLVPDDVIQGGAWPKAGMMDAEHATIDDARWYKRFALWAMALEPTGSGSIEPTTGEYYERYSCSYFSRSVDGLGVCGLGDERPFICKNFPLLQGPPGADPLPRSVPESIILRGLAISGFDRCAWNVDVDPDPRIEQSRSEAREHLEKVDAAELAIP